MYAWFLFIRCEKPVKHRKQSKNSENIVRFVIFLLNFDAKINKNNYICNKNRNIMEELTLKSTLKVAQWSELTDAE